MGALGGLEEFLIFLDGSSTIEDSSADVRHVLGEPEVLIADLEGEFARVAEYDDRDTVFCWIELLEGSEDEDGGLSVTRLCLTEDVHAEDRLRDAFLLHWKQRNEDDGLKAMKMINIPSEGCSKPRSEMARSSSCFSRKSLKMAPEKKKKKKEKKIWCQPGFLEQR